MASVTQYDKKFLLELINKMVRIRRFEEKAAQMYGMRKIGGFCHLYNGQEALGVGSIEALDLSKDYVLTSYRDHGHAIACGMSMDVVMAELFGKIDGCSRGKGGSMHMFDVEKHMLGGNGIVGAQIPIAGGVAFACKYNKTGGVSVCYFGDGAIHQGAFHETMNLAQIWELPLIMIVENNKFGMGTSVTRVSSIDQFDKKAGGYGAEGHIVDGMSVLAVYEAMKKARKGALKGRVQLLDIQTYRYKGHSMSDPGRYRTKEELESYKKKDPITVLKNDMVRAKMLDDKEFEKINTNAKQQAQKAVEFAENSADPPLETMYEDVYV